MKTEINSVLHEICVEMPSRLLRFYVVELEKKCLLKKVHFD